jgi:DNA-binding MarR family transcriptional regulator
MEAERSRLLQHLHGEARGAIALGGARGDATPREVVDGRRDTALLVGEREREVIEAVQGRVGTHAPILPGVARGERVSAAYLDKDLVIFLFGDHASPVRPRAPRRLRKPSARDDLRAVVDECIVLADRLFWLAEHIHGAEGRGSVRRGILRGLGRYGPQTIPEMARARSVTRQNVQPVVAELEREGLIERIENPRHRRSPRFAITAAGLDLVARMDKNDTRVLAAVGRGLAAADIATTARTLRAVRERFEVRWRAALATPSRSD